VKHGMTPVCIV